MTRRQSMMTLTAAAAALPASAAGNPIQLHVDLEVDLGKEKEMLKNYTGTFRPAITKQPGFVDVKLLKFRKAMAGEPPKSWNYRLLISFQTEEQRVRWVATDLHQKVWPTIESCLKGAKYQPLLYDVA
jgi:heme-degrading monooxygenase HmoA